jgi:hypothetical protein
MTYRSGSMALALALGVLVAGCAKKQAEVSSTSAPASPAVPSQAAPAAAPAPATPAVGTTPAAPAASAPLADTGMADTTAKLAAAEWALKQDDIKHDPDGQWASEAAASSSYNDAQGDAGWSPKQATGAPDVDKYSDNQHAWAPKTQDGGIEWLDLKYLKPVHASEVRIRESLGSGAVVRVELFDEAGAAHIVWQGVDPTR